VHVIGSDRAPRARVSARRARRHLGRQSDLTFVSLDIDGRNVVNLSYAAASNSGFTQANPYGLVLLQTRPLDNLTIGFPEPLAYAKELVLSVHVKEDDVVQILGNVVHGSA
jgi:hypothetical protein